MTEQMNVDQFKAAAATLSKVKAKGRTKHERGQMNRVEREYAAELDLRLKADDIVWWGFEALTLRLADRTTYTPDFVILHNDGLVEIVEIKGHWEDDARVKIKVAAEQFFMFQFVAITVTKRGKKREEF
jgi:hypothetical protein